MPLKNAKYLSSSTNMTSSPKPRSGSPDLPQKTSNSKPIKGVPSSSNMDTNAPKIMEKRPSKITVSSPEKRIVRVSEIQQQLSQVQEELQKAKDQLAAAEEEKDRVLDELREMKKVSDDANLRLSDALLAHKKVEESSNIEKSRVEEWERASIESAKKRDQAWQLELDTVQKEHDAAIEALSFSTRELEEVKKKLSLAVEAQNRANKEAEDAKDVAEENAKRVEGLSVELNYVKELLDSNGELATKEAGSVVESLKLQLEKAKNMEARLAENESLLEKLNLELSYVRESEARAVNSLSESKMIIDELQVEIEKAKESETKMLESLTSQTKQLEEAKMSLEEAKLEIISLQENIEILEVSKAESTGDLNLSHQNLETPKLDKDSGETLNSIQIAKENLVGAQQSEEFAMSSSHSAAEEMILLRADLKSATEAEEKSKKAMDDLALALKEVTLEANQVKEKLASTQSELEDAKMEAEHSKLILEGREEKFQVLLDEAKKETDRLKEEFERLKLEAEESVNAWNEKVLNLVNYLKMCEEELTDSKQENDGMVESLKKAEEVAKATKEENSRLRDILKQAVNEATVAKEASQIARTENSQLKDSLSDKDSELQSIKQENENIKVKEAAALENVKELKRVLGEASTMELSKNVGLSEASKKPNTAVREFKDSKKLMNHPSELPKKPEVENKRYREEYKNATLNSGPFNGSAFNMVASPNQEDGETITSDDFDHIDRTHFEEMENERISPTRQRKKKALLRRFGDMLRKRTNHK